MEDLKKPKSELYDDFIDDFASSLEEQPITMIVFAGVYGCLSKEQKQKGIEVIKKYLSEEEPSAELLDVLLEVYHTHESLYFLFDEAVKIFENIEDDEEIACLNFSDYEWKFLGEKGSKRQENTLTMMAHLSK